MTRTKAQRHGDRCMTENRTRFDGTEIFIYAYVTDSNEVVYIGRTYDPATRHGAHRQKAPWWNASLAFSVIDVATSWGEAVIAEARAIRSHRPLVNIQHNGRVA